MRRSSWRSSRQRWTPDTDRIGLIEGPRVAVYVSDLDVSLGQLGRPDLIVGFAIRAYYLIARLEVPGHEVHHRHASALAACKWKGTGFT